MCNEVSFKSGATARIIQAFQWSDYTADPGKTYWYRATPVYGTADALVDGTPVVVGVTGASGVIYAQRLVRTLLEFRYEVSLVVSAAGRLVLKEELPVGPGEDPWGDSNRDLLRIHPEKDVGAPFCSGSFRFRGMVVIPASMGRQSDPASATHERSVSPGPESTAGVHRPDRQCDNGSFSNDESPGRRPPRASAVSSCSCPLLTYPDCPECYPGMSCEECGYSETGIYPDDCPGEVCPPGTVGFYPDCEEIPKTETPTIFSQPDQLFTAAFVTAEVTTATEVSPNPPPKPDTKTYDSCTIIDGSNTNVIEGDFKET